MLSLVPIIGQEYLDCVPYLRDRIDDLISSMGMNSFWVTIGNIREIHRADPLYTIIPLIIVADADSTLDDFNDLICPLKNKFSQAVIIRNKYNEIAKAIYEYKVSRLSWYCNISNPFVQSAIKYIYDKLAFPNLTVSMVAKDIHVSYATLERTFHNELGRSVHDFILNKRVEEANRLLRDTDLPVYSIAAAVGYGELSTFDRVYKRRMHVTPKQYRKTVKSMSEISNILSRNM